MKYFALVIFIFQIQFGYSQKMEMRPLEELINIEDSGWELVKEWKTEAKNKIEILDKIQ